ncbi:BCCT family transporter [Polaromonas sp. UC242_47]|uniref:BCCT family transporter n=1 Tax=Polaromonas sp. UC242_47 TaxID=3374626 RepID=UPI00379E5CD2
MQRVMSAGMIAMVVLWGLLSPDSLDSVLSLLLASITRNFGWFYLWVVLGLVLMAISVTRAISQDWHAEQRRDKDLRKKMREFIKE